MTPRPDAREEAIARPFDAAYFQDQYRDYASQNPPRKLDLYLRTLAPYGHLTGR